MWRRKFLTLGAQAGGAVVSGYRRPLGYQQLTVTSAAQGLTVPAGQSGLVVGYCVIQCSGGATTDFASWRDDGTAPTISIGMRLFAGQELDYTGDPYTIKFIIGSGSPVLNIAYYA